MQYLYNHWEHNLGNSIYALLSDLNGVDEKLFTRVADDLDEAGLIEGVGQSMPCDIKPPGILEAENRQLVPAETIRSYQSMRFEIIKAAFEAREEDGRYAEANVDDLLSEFNFNDSQLFNNVRFLQEAGLIDSRGTRSFSITTLGIEQYNQWNEAMAETYKMAFETTTNTYTVVKPIGQGGVGTVYEVTDTKSNTFALKVISESVFSTEKSQRFKNELGFLARNQHDNLVPVLDDGFVTRNNKKIPFYVMPKFDETLRNLMERGIATDKILPYFANLLDGVEFLHIKGNFHRDLKPENVLYDGENDRLLIADLGAAHFEEDQLQTFVETKPNSRLANFEYAAPEQREMGQSVTHRADIYALGLILNKLFTGRTPLGEGYPKIGEFSPEHSYLDDVVSQMIHHSPEKRPETIEKVKIRLMASQNEFISLQRLDSLRNKVVPIIEVSDALTATPVSIIRTDFDHQSFTFELSAIVTEDWKRLFKEIDYRNHALSHAWPQDMEINGNIISVNCTGEAASLVRSGKVVLELATRYINITNQNYKEFLEGKARQEEHRMIQAQKDAEAKLREDIRREEERQRILLEMTLP